MGQFTDNRGEFYNQDTFKGRAIYVRYVWLNLSPEPARMEQSWSAGRGTTYYVQLDLRTRAIAKAFRRQNKFKQGYEGKRTRQTNLRRR